MGRCFLLLVVTLVVVGSCQAGRWHHGKVKARALTHWTKWRCISEGLKLQRTRKLLAHGHKYCPGGHGTCHRIQRQKKDADGKCGKCGVDKALPLLSSTSTAETLPNMTTTFNVGMDVVIDGIAVLGYNLYVLCHNTSSMTPYPYQINVYDSFFPGDPNIISVPSASSGDVLLGLAACASNNYLFFTDLTKKLLYRMDVSSGSVVSFPATFDGPGHNYDDVTGNSDCTLAVATMGPNVLKFTNNGAKFREVSLPGVNGTHSAAYVPGCYVVGYLAENGSDCVSVFNASGGLKYTSSKTTFTDVKSVISNAGFVLVLDGSRVALLNSKMVYIRDLLTNVKANHMSLDVTGGSLYLEDTDGSSGEVTVTSYFIFG